MRTGTCYFYLDTKKKIKYEWKYEVIEVPVYNHWISASEEKAKKLAKILDKKLAGGFFVGTKKPHDFKENFTIYKYQL